MSQATKLTLVSRRYCHLCQEMEQALAVLGHDGRELCHYFLDVSKVRDYLSKIG